MSKLAMADMLFPDDDLPEGKPQRQLSLKAKYLQSRQLPGPAIARRMLWSAAGPELLRDISRRRPSVILIETPDDWFDLIHEAARDLIRAADFVTCQSAKASKQSSTQEAGLISATASTRSLVVIAAIGVSAISRSVLLSLDHRVVIKPPDRAILAGALRTVFGLRRPPLCRRISCQFPMRPRSWPLSAPPRTLVGPSHGSPLCPIQRTRRQRHSRPVPASRS